MDLAFQDVALSQDLAWWIVGALAVAAAVAMLLYLHQLRVGRRLAASVDDLTHQLGDVDDDGLPGVMSQRRFKNALDQAAQRCDRGEAALCVLFVSLDNLESLNQSFGHASGDRAIRRTARMMVGSGSRGRAVTRTGGDAFVMLFESSIAGARQLASQLIACLGSEEDGNDPPLACSIGIASYPLHGSRARIVGHASTAMRHVRNLGGGDHMLYDTAMAVDLKDQADLLRDLRQAAARGEFELVYQPKIDARSLQITAAEALLRWNHPQRGVISPAVFVPLAERFGLIVAIGGWVIDEACRQAGIWRKSGLRMRVAINISAHQMRQDNLVDRLLSALKANELSANRFTCEITESVAMEDTQVTQRTFERMGHAGLHVSIDDFGVGQASLSYLRRLPAAELKIDASFVQDLETSVDARSIVDAVIRLAHALQLRVVAEGVETERQSEILVQMGCDELQGFLFARPMSAQALSLWAGDDELERRSGFRPSLFRDTIAIDL